MKKQLVNAMIGLSWFVPMLVPAADYVIDKEGAHASITFKVSHLGYSYVVGRFNDFSGDFSYDVANPTAAKVNVKVNTLSVDSNHAERDKHIRSADFLNTEKFAEATFVSTSIEDKGNGDLVINGNFTLNGVTKPLAIKAHAVGEGKDPWGGYRAGFIGTTRFAMKDYGITKDLGPTATNVELDLVVEGVRK